MTRSVLVASVSAFVVAAAACGGSSDGAPAAAAATDQDAGVYTPPAPPPAEQDDPVDPVYPSAHVAIPELDYHGGRVLTSPKIVTVTFPGDAMKDRLQTFGDTITATPWWDTVTAEYCDKTNNCVGRGVAGGHVELTEDALASYTDSSQGKSSSIQDFIKAKVADGTFPTPTDQTIYAIYFPTTSKITLDGSRSCSAFGAYHNTVKVVPPGSPDGTAPIAVPYAIMPRCGGERSVTVSASHEFAEAATDPDVGLNAIAFYMDNQLWAAAGGENADLCVSLGGGDDGYIESGFNVQRSWSIKSAAAGHDPCVPIPANTVYFNAAPAAGKDQISLKVGESATIELKAFSDAPMDDWEIHAVDFGRYQGQGSNLDFELSKTTVHNGSKPKLTVTLSGNPPDGYAAYAIVSKNAKQETHYWPAVVYVKE